MHPKHSDPSRIIICWPVDWLKDGPRTNRSATCEDRRDLPAQTRTAYWGDQGVVVGLGRVWSLLRISLSPSGRIRVSSEAIGNERVRERGVNADSAAVAGPRPAVILRAIKPFRSLASCQLFSTLATMATPTTAPPSTTHDEEDAAGYCIGGYHPVRIGDKFAHGRYTVVRKLGWGHFSTVWLARDHARNPPAHVALKVVKSADRYTETALDEVRLCARAAACRGRGNAGDAHVINLIDHFMHAGPHGNHVCMVFEVLGESLLSVVRRPPYPTSGVPLQLVKQVARQILQGLDFLHARCGIVHTDLKPENVLVQIDDVEAVIQAELALSQDPPMTVVGVPPSQGRGGNRTPRGESVRPAPRCASWHVQLTQLIARSA